MSQGLHALDWTLRPAPRNRGRLPAPSQLEFAGASRLDDDLIDPMGPLVSFEEYLRREEASDHRNEFIGGRLYAMAGASDVHNTITTNLVALLRPLVRKQRCRVYSSDMKLQIDGVPGLPDGSGTVCYYPDVMVTCSNSDSGEKLIKKEPSLLIEVLSKSTELKDRTTKLDHYRTIPQLQQYWIVSQDTGRVQVWQQPEPGQWVATEYPRQEDAIALPFLGASIPVAEVYEDTALSSSA